MVPLVTAMACMTIGAPQPAKLVALIRDIMGWEVRHDGPIDHAIEETWGIAPGSAGERMTVLCSPGSDRGMIRVVQGPDRYPRRQLGARWSGVEIVVMKDLEGLYRALDKHPDFKTSKAPNTADFTDVGANIHQFYFGRGPGGTHFMFTMAVTQARDHTFPAAPARVGYIFSIPLVSSDFRKSQKFYRGALGMVPVLEDHLESGLWHEAWDLPPTPVELEILKGDAPDFGLGGIEHQGYSDQFIDPTPWHIDRLDGGTCLGTYTVKDIDAAYQAVTASGLTHLCTAPRRLDTAPYHGARTFAFIGPLGERMELTERFT